MAELRILGARRVEALQEVLEGKKKAAISALVIPSSSEIRAKVDAEYKVTAARGKVATLKAQLDAAITDLNAITGEGNHATLATSYRYETKTSYDARYDELVEQLRTKPIAELEAEYNAKKTQLWLCETLEQAKAIVGID
jgi:hypothetical protein